MTQIPDLSNMPNSFKELKLLVQQFESFLPDDKRKAIQTTITQIEESGGIQNAEQGEQILSGLMQMLGLTGLQK